MFLPRSLLFLSFLSFVLSASNHAHKAHKPHPKPKPHKHSSVSKVIPARPTTTKSSIVSIPSTTSVNPKPKPHKHSSVSKVIPARPTTTTAPIVSIPSTTPVVARPGCPAQKVLSRFYPNWTPQTPEDIPWTGTNLVFYFCLPTTQSGITVPEGVALANLQDFVQQAHLQGKKALVTIGGWTGSVYFSSLVATPFSRANFAGTLAALIGQYGFDGIDIDWEFVGRQGAGSNIVSPDDATNFLAFLKVLRSIVGPGKLLHASVSTSGFVLIDSSPSYFQLIGSSGAPLTSTSAYATYLDYITIMAYDMYGPWSSTTGPNAALAQCNPAGGGSVQNAVGLWRGSGFPACKILLGVPTYSHEFKTSSPQLITTTLNGFTSKAFQPLASPQPADPVPTYKQLIANGMLSADGTIGINGYTRYWDSCTSTPFLFSPSTQLWIGYEDTRSTQMKANYAVKAGLAGINLYDSTGAVPGTYAAARKSLDTAKGN